MNIMSILSAQSCMGLFAGGYRTATVVAIVGTELYSLSRSDIDSILEDFPELGKEFLKMVDKYMQKIVANKRNPRLSRVGFYSQDAEVLHNRRVR